MHDGVLIGKTIEKHGTAGRMLQLPNVWNSGRGYLHYDRLRAEAAELSRRHRAPLSLAEWQEFASGLHDKLSALMRLEELHAPLDIEFHGEIRQTGYRIIPISFVSRPGIRVTGTLYVPDGKGPFPAVLNPHGHHVKGKIFPRFQARGHVLAQNGFVVLTADAPGSGERGDNEHQWEYHGGLRAAGLYLTGDSLLAWQVRDNKRALDVLESLPYVDSERIGVTGASGGGNQAMWLAALDLRAKVVVPVVSVSSFEAYVGRRTCVCETLPGGLHLAEEWGVLGLIAPRPMLIINSIHDQPAFGVSAMSATSRVVQEIYEFHGARSAFDTRLIDLPHGYWPPMLEAMLGWMRYWLQGEGNATPVSLPDWNRSLESELLCYNLDERPEECCNHLNKQTLFSQLKVKPSALKNDARQELAKLTGWQKTREASFHEVKSSIPDVQMEVILSPRELPLPVLTSSHEYPHFPSEIRLILSPSGKSSSFVRSHWETALYDGAVAVSFDLPATGELYWEADDIFGEFHDSARAALWLGYSLPCEWSESIATVARALMKKYPDVALRIIADRETVLAALIALVLDPKIVATLEEHNCPKSLCEIYQKAHGSLAWIIPGILRWGDLDDLRALHKSNGDY